ncbi:MAG: hypothetical protein FJ405_09745 [Verrucomicrobia bacterium]|nr:hypothetical protein [Verrucomicrobiota bacterium]
MISRLFFALCMVVSLAAPAELLARASREGQGLLRNTLVEVEISRKQHDYQMPWNRSGGNIRKSAIMIAQGELLTTADGLSDQTMLRAQKEGRGTWSDATIAWVDYHANLAILNVKNPDFWKGLKPVEIAAKVSPSDEFNIHRWRNGNIEVRKAEFSQFTVSDMKLSFVQVAQVELTSDISVVGWGEPIIVNGKLAALATLHTRSTCMATPAPFIRHLLDARKKKQTTHLGFFDFMWQQTENPEIHKALNFPGEPKGVLVIEPARKMGQSNVVRVRDIILQVDGFDIDTQGNYEDPMYGHLILENLATRSRFAGDEVKLKLWRDGQTVEETYRLPKADHRSKLMPDFLFDQEPEYLIVGGLVFQPLSNQYLRSWGDDWKRRAPFRLNYYNNEPVTKERPGLVLLSNVLPDIFNLGYQDTRLLVVDQVNGRKIARLKDLSEALQQPKDGFHVIDFMRGDSLRRMVLDATAEKKATERVLDRYRIEQASVIHQ